MLIIDKMYVQEKEIDWENLIPSLFVETYPPRNVKLIDNYVRRYGAIFIGSLNDDVVLRATHVKPKDTEVEKGTFLNQQLYVGVNNWGRYGDFVTFISQKTNRPAFILMNIFFGIVFGALSYEHDNSEIPVVCKLPIGYEELKRLNERLTNNFDNLTHYSELYTPLMIRRV